MISGSFAHKIRIWTASLLIVFLSAVFLGWHELSQIRSRTSSVAANTEPLIHLTRDVSQAVTSINALAEELSSATSFPELEGASERAHALLKQVGSRMEPLAGDAAAAGTMENFAELANAQREIIGYSDQIVASKTVALSALLRVEEHLLAEQARLSEQIKHMRSPGPTGRQHFDAVDQLLTVSRLESAASHMSLLTAMLDPELGEVSLSSATDLRQMSNDFIGQLPNLSNAGRASLIREDIGEFHDVIIGANGSLAVMGRLSKAVAARDALKATVIRGHTELTSRLEREMAQAEAAFLDATKEAASVFQRFLTRDVLLIGAAVLAISFYFWLEIERKLVSRLTNIARRVREIADGEVSHPVEITGADEVGEVEQAVEASRQMSISLQRMNEELERFAYVAAHDLRSPLRAVSDLIRWTHEDHGGELPAGACENLDMIDVRVKRLNGHLTALLDYARAGQTEAAWGVLDLPSFVDDLQASHAPDGRFKVKLEGAPRVIETYPAPVATILLNLVSNAIKHHDLDTGRIVISVSQDDDFISFAVSDDGPGIMPEYHEKIFVLFQTLKSRDVVEGTGLGLALVQKLALSLGGGVELASDPRTARGTTFTVTLPADIAVGCDLDTDIGKAA